VEQKSRSSLAGVVCLAGLLLLVPVGGLILLMPVETCPYCLGKGLLEEPPQAPPAVRWVRQADLVPRVCDCCRDHWKLGRFRARRWDRVSSPQPPIYRTEEAAAYQSVRRIRIKKISEETRVWAGPPPLRGSSSRPDLIPVLAAALQDEDYAVRATAAYGLAGMNHELALPYLIGAFKSETRAEEGLCRGLQELAGSPALREQIVAFLREVVEAKSFSLDARFYSAVALMDLGQLHNSDVFVEALRRHYRYSDQLMTAIIHYDRKDTISMTIQAMASTPPPQMEGLANVLSELTGEKFGSDPTAWYHWFEKNKDRFPPQVE